MSGELITINTPTHMHCTTVHFDLMPFGLLTFGRMSWRRIYTEDLNLWLILKIFVIGENI
jgi:hypothetical protein